MAVEMRVATLSSNLGIVAVAPGRKLDSSCNKRLSSSGSHHEGSVAAARAPRLSFRPCFHEPGIEWKRSLRSGTCSQPSAKGIPMCFDHIILTLVVVVCLCETI